MALNRSNGFAGALAKKKRKKTRHSNLKKKRARIASSNHRPPTTTHLYNASRQPGAENRACIMPPNAAHFQSSYRPYYSLSFSPSPLSPRFPSLETHHLTSRHGEMATSARPPRPVCTFFLQNRCTKGVQCLFSHDRSNLEVTPSRAATAKTGPGSIPTPCKFFQQGYCSRGAACFFQHVPADPPELELAGPTGSGFGLEQREKVVYFAMYE